MNHYFILINDKEKFITQNFRNIIGVNINTKDIELNENDIIWIVEDIDDKYRIVMIVYYSCFLDKKELDEINKILELNYSNYIKYRKKFNLLTCDLFIKKNDSFIINDFTKYDKSLMLTNKNDLNIESDSISRYSTMSEYYF